MKKTIGKIAFSIAGVILISFVMFAILVYLCQDYIAYEKILGKTDIGLIINYLNSFFYAVTFVYPACLYAFLGNRYLRLVKKVPVKTVKEKLKTAGYTFLFFLAGEFVTWIPVSLSLQLVMLLYVWIFNMNNYHFWKLFSPAATFFLGVFSCAVAILIYQILLEKHLQSNESKEN